MNYINTTILVFFLFSTHLFAQDSSDLAPIQRVQDCRLIEAGGATEQINELTLFKQPYLILIEKENKNWILRIGSLHLDTTDEKGPALKFESQLLDQYIVNYDVWVDGSYEYQIQFDLNSETAQLFWWGTGEQNSIGKFACEFGN